MLSMVAQMSKYTEIEVRSVFIRPSKLHDLFIKVIINTLPRNLIYKKALLKVTSEI